MKTMLSAFFFCVFAVAGCYRYPAVPSSVAGSTYTGRPADGSSRSVALRRHLEGLKVLTLAEAQRLALENNPDFLAAWHSVSAARMALCQRRGEYSPVLSADFSLSNRHAWTGQVLRGTEPSDSRTDTFSTSTAVRADWLLFDGFGRLNRLRAASDELDRRSALRENTRRILLRQVAYAYNTVLLAIEERRIAEEDRRFQTTSLEDARSKFAAGRVARSSVLNFEILRNNAEARMIAADYVYEAAVYALALLMGCEEGTLPPPLKFESGFGDLPAELPSVELYLDSALAARPDLRASRADVRRAYRLVLLAYADYFPVINAFAAFGVSTARNSFHGYSTRRSATGATNLSFSYGLTAELTVFDGLRRYNAVRERKAQLAAAELGLAGEWFTVVGEVRAAHANYLQAVKCADLYRRNSELSRKQRELVMDQYRSGYCEITRLNEAQRDLVSAEANLATSRINIYNAVAELEAAIGGAATAAGTGVPSRNAPAPEQ